MSYDVTPPTTLELLNRCNGADKVVHAYVKNTWSSFEPPLNFVFMGIAYGGDVEAAAKNVGDRGTVWGFDTFEDRHPRHLAKDPDGREATCMDHWYKPQIFGTDKLSIDYQRETLKDYKNVKLIKGEVNEHSCDDIGDIHFAFLDMDIVVSMQNGYDAVKDKIVKDGYLFLHDVTAKNNIEPLFHWFYDEIITDGDRWEVEGIWPEHHLAGLKRI